MDGTIFRWGYMNTSNIGRRLELTWWPAWETFRKASEFSDEAHIAMLLGMIRQAELITNPSSFAVHDDGAAHTTMASAADRHFAPGIFRQRKVEKAGVETLGRRVGKSNFIPDGSHVSLSTGYNWATILSLENFIRFYEQLGTRTTCEIPDPTGETRSSIPYLISTPSQTQIPLNDGGWGMVDDHFRRSLHWFPHREDFKWLATKGAEGKPPEKTLSLFRKCRSVSHANRLGRRPAVSILRGRALGSQSRKA